jgi:alpha-glucosidase
MQVDATVVNAHTFRLHVSFSGTPAPHRSLFISADASQASGTGKAFRDGAFSGVRSRSGALLVNREKGEWMLKDGQNRVVIPATPLVSLATDDRSGGPELICPMGVTGTAAIYGSGDMNGGILQERGQSRVGNGITGVPYYWSSTGYGVLALGEDDNAPANWQRGGTNGAITWTVPGHSMDLYLTPAARLQEAEEDYAELAGRPPVPPRWAMGYLQSRWGWQDRAYIEDTLKQFVDRKLPVDAFIFDFEWYTPQPDYSVPAAGKTNYNDFSWNPVLFPEPERQIAEMHAHGVHVVGIRKPRLGNSELLTELRGRGWVTAASELRGGSGIAPAGSRGTEQRLLNYGKKEVRDWYASQLVPLLEAGIDGWWNDEGEQSYTTYTYWNQSEALAVSEANPSHRLWTLNRAFQPGLQRYGAAAWTGDIGSNWRSLAETPTRLLNWSLAGMYYGACDIGGFTGRDTPELLTRWMQAGVFFPVMRSHSVNSVQPRFPWLYGGPAEAAMRKALELRYRLVPYYYSLAHQAAEKGTPLMRPLAMAYPEDPQVANLTSQWLMGDGLMPAPILSQTNHRSVYFPTGTWYTFDSNQTRPGGQSADVSAELDEIPVFVRAGTILPLAPAIQHTDALPGGALDLQVYPGGNASFTLAEDDGKTTDYTKGQVRRVAFAWDDAAKTLSWKVSGPYRGKDIFKRATVTVFDPTGVAKRTASLEKSGKLTN